MTSFTISDEVHRRLAEVLLEDQDLLIGLRRVRPAEDPERAGLYRCQCMVAVRRPLDPETSELRRLDVTLRRLDEGFEVIGVTGLEGLATQFE